MVTPAPQHHVDVDHPLETPRHDARQDANKSLVVQTMHPHGVVELRLNRPGALNTFNTALYLATTAALENLTTCKKTRIIIFTAAGEKTFCAGMDLREASTSQYAQSMIAAARSFMNALIASPHILMAAVFGNVVGIGVTMLLHCDFVFAHPSSRFQTPFSSVGFVPEFASSVLFHSVMGPTITSRLLLRGETLSAYVLQRAGVLTVVSAHSHDVHSAALHYAMSWSQQAGQEQWAVVQTAKALIRDPIRHHVRQALKVEFDVIAKLMHSGKAPRLMAEKLQQLHNNRRRSNL